MGVLSKITKVTFCYVLREVNKKVDKLATLDVEGNDLLIVNDLFA